MPRALSAPPSPAARAAHFRRRHAAAFTRSAFIAARCENVACHLAASVITRVRIRIRRSAPRGAAVAAVGGARAERGRAAAAAAAASAVRARRSGARPRLWSTARRHARARHARRTPRRRACRGRGGRRPRAPPAARRSRAAARRTPFAARARSVAPSRSSSRSSRRPRTASRTARRHAAKTRTSGPLIHRLDARASRVGLRHLLQPADLLRLLPPCVSVSPSRCFSSRTFDCRCAGVSTSSADGCGDDEEAGGRRGGVGMYRSGRSWLSGTQRSPSSGASSLRGVRGDGGTERAEWVAHAVRGLESPSNCAAACATTARSAGWLCGCLDHVRVELQGGSVYETALITSRAAGVRAVYTL